MRCILRKKYQFNEYKIILSIFLVGQYYEERLDIQNENKSSSSRFIIILCMKQTKIKHDLT